MFRKLTIALTATAALTAAALAPTSASAWGWHPHHHYGHGWGYGAAAFGALAATAVIASNNYYGPNCYVVRRWVETPVGPKPRRVTVCD